MNQKKKKSIKKKAINSAKNIKKPNVNASKQQASQAAIVSRLQTEELVDVVEVLKDVQQLPCDLKMIWVLNEQKKQQIKHSHPSLASYYYLDPRERTKFFHQINQKYRKSMKPEHPPGSAPRKKTIKFKKRFQIKLFNKEQNTSKVCEKKSFTERQMRNVHFT